jgi:hypothetical protein
MRTTRIRLLGVLLAAASIAGNGCILLPEIKDKVVQLAVGGTTSAEFVAAGLINTFDQRDTVNIDQEVNLTKILSDAGIDVSGVKDIKVSGISYRVVKPDPVANRQIQGGTVTAQRLGVTGEVPVVTSFTETVNSVVSYKTAPVDPAGVGLMNGVLTDLLTSAQNGTAMVNPVIVFHINGVSSPTNQVSDFTWEIKLNVSVLGEVKVSIPG